MPTPASPRLLEDLGDKPRFYGDCCAGISWGLLESLAARLPTEPALVLSVGSGSGRLESILLVATHENVNVVGVEVPPCENVHLPDTRLLRVPCTASLHPNAWLASTLMFVYPRNTSLVHSYLEAFGNGALEQIVWLGPRSDASDVELILKDMFYKIEEIQRGIADHELLVFATLPRPMVGR